MQIPIQLTQLVQKFVGFVFLEVHDAVKHLVDGIQNIHAERSDIVVTFSFGLEMEILAFIKYFRKFKLHSIFCEYIIKKYQFALVNRRHSNAPNI